MLEGLFIASVIGTICQWFKEVTEPTIPASHWANKKLIEQDRMKNISEKEFARNLASGKYKVTKTHPEPHRDPKSGKIIIENCKLYREDVWNYGAVQAQQWVKQGKYNLNPEELKKEQERIKAEYDYLYSLRR